jgi:hypothetical protein
MATSARCSLSLKPLFTWEPEELPRYWKFQGTDSNFLIYDESLISSKSAIVDVGDVSHAFTFCPVYFETES